MRARAHGLSGGVAWLAVANGAQLAGHPFSLVGDAAGTLMATGYALWPDLDCQATAARSLGWPTELAAAGIARLAGGHRKATHYAISTVALASAAWLLSEIPWVSFVFLVFGLAWAQAALAADDRGRARLRWSIFAIFMIPMALLRIALAFLLMRRVHSGVRWFFSILGALAVLALDATPTWVPASILVGGLAHLAGDMLTRDAYPILGPFTDREFGGLGWIPPIPPPLPGQRSPRVTPQEWFIEAGLTLLAIGAALPLLHLLTPTLALLEATTRNR